MMAVVTTGSGGYEMLDYRRVARPEPESGEVLIQVLAAGINNTEINTRLGWYSSSVTDSTDSTQKAADTDNSENKTAVGTDGGDDHKNSDGGWNEITPFPFIQGTDCCGRVIKSGPGVDQGVSTHLHNKRVLVRSCMRLNGFSSLENLWMASDFDGAFAQYLRVPASEVFAVNCDWSDAELATLPCAYGTAENMVHRADIKAADRVLITGASGGVGSAVVQLVKRRGAEVIAVAGRSKFPQLKALGVTRLYSREDNLIKALGENCIDAVFDNVAGSGFTPMLKLLRRGGRYASSGAIAGPMVTMDMRDFYLKDIQLIGCTAWDEPVFPNLIRYVEQGEIQPLLAGTFPLADIAAAQQKFLRKEHFGNMILLP